MTELSYDDQDVRDRILRAPKEDVIDVLNDLVDQGVLEFVGEYYIN